MAVERKVTVRVNLEAHSTVGRKLAEERRQVEEFNAARKRGMEMRGQAGGGGGLTSAGAAPAARQRQPGLTTGQPARQQQPALIDPSQPRPERPVQSIGDVMSRGRAAAQQASPGELQKQWARLNEEVGEWRAKVSVSGTSRGAALLGEAAALEEQYKATKKLREESGKLDFYRTRRGQQTLLQQAHVMREQSRMEDRARMTAERGRVGAALGTFAERGAPVFGAARNAALVGGGVMAAAVASNDALSQQMSGSFGMLSREISIAITPDMVRLSGAMQSAARGVRWLNESTNGAAGRLVFLGTAAATGVAALGTVANTVSGAATGLRALKEGASLAVNAFSRAGTQAAVNAGANFASTAVGNVAGGAIGRTATNTAGSAVTNTATSAAGASLFSRFAGPAAIITAITEQATTSARDVYGLATGAEDASWGRTALNLTGIGQGLRYARYGGELGFQAADMASPYLPQGANDFFRWSRNTWINRTLLGDPNPANAIGGAGGGQQTQALFDRKGAIGEVGSHYDEMVLRQYQGSDREREQNSRAQAQLAQSLDNLNSTIQQSFPPQGPQ